MLLVYPLFKISKSVIKGSGNLTKVMVFGGAVFRATVFGLLAASKTAPLKPHPKNLTPKNAQKWAFFENCTLKTPKNAP